MMSSIDRDARDYEIFEIDPVDANIFAYEFSDEALEAAAGGQWACTQTISGEGSQTSQCGTYNNGCC